MASGKGGEKKPQIAEDLEFQRRSWLFGRVGWVVVSLVLIASLLGLSGDGPLAEAEALTYDGTLVVRYERVARHRSPSRLQLDVKGIPAHSAPVRVWLDRRYLDELQVSAVYPEPESVEVSPDRTTWSFSARGPSIRVTFNLQHDGIGSQHARVGLDAGPEVAFSQFVVP